MDGGPPGACAKPGVRGTRKEEPRRSGSPPFSQRLAQWCSHRSKRVRTPAFVRRETGHGPHRSRRSPGRSLVLTSNRSPSDWYPLFPNAGVGESLLDRVSTLPTKCCRKERAIARREIRTPRSRLSRRPFS
jgi:hypothetical protein